MSATSTKSIDAITFAVWSPQEIRKYSVVEITQPETYDEDGMAVQGGLMDGRLGVLEPGQKCLTDGNTAARSPGHFGHIELAEPVLHIAFVDNIYKLLQSTCRTCGRIKMSPDDIKEFSKIKERQAIVLLMAVMAVGSMGAASQAFADVPLDIEVNGDTFDHASTIIVDGQIGDLRTGTPVTVIVTGSTGVVTIEQITPSSDGSFSVSINTASPLMKYDGEYKIKATYGDAGINDVVFVTLEGGLVKGTSASAHEEHHEYEAADLTNELNYNISGGMVHSITSTNDDSLLITIHDAEDGSELTITLPDDIITPFNDGSFFVLVNGEESDDAEQNGNSVTIPFDADTTEIEIVGTHVVPEFGTIAMIVLAVAIVSIIAVSAKSRLSIMPRI